MTLNTHDRSDTQIVVTIGPACGAREKLSRMIDAGLDVARINCAWGDHAQYESFIVPLREEAESARLRIPFILDLPGPRVQEGDHHRFGKGEMITEKDLADVEFGIRHRIEYFAQSYVGDAEDVALLRSRISERHGTAKIIAKIERADALRNIDSIVRVADAIMIARGDLGNEIPLETMPFVEADIIRIARKTKRPVIVATEMLSSMIEKETPSRADITDIAYAVTKGADAVMLSNETATGRYPIEAVATMERAVLEAEKHMAIARRAL